MELSAFIKIQFIVFSKIWSENVIMEPQSRNRLLLSGASHEGKLNPTSLVLVLNKPVSTTLNHTISNHEIALGKNLDRRAREYIDISSTASQSSESAISNGLDLTRTEKLDQFSHEQDFVLHAVMLGVIDEFQEKAYRKGLGFFLNMDMTSLPAVVRGYPQGLRKAISNLLSNSIENSLKGDITVTVHSVESMETEANIEIVIQDQGIGISEE